MYGIYGIYKGKKITENNRNRNRNRGIRPITVYGNRNIWNKFQELTLAIQSLSQLVYSKGDTM